MRLRIEPETPGGVDVGKFYFRPGACGTDAPGVVRGALVYYYQLAGRDGLPADAFDRLVQVLRPVLSRYDYR